MLVCHKKNKVKVSNQLVHLIINSARESLFDVKVSEARGQIADFCIDALKLIASNYDSI